LLRPLFDILLLDPLDEPLLRIDGFSAGKVSLPWQDLLLSRAFPKFIGSTTFGFKKFPGFSKRITPGVLSRFINLILCLGMRKGDMFWLELSLGNW
jgi:hypothetical protein